jgi:hypothetical protein
MKKNIKLVCVRPGFYKYTGNCLCSSVYYETAEFSQNELDKYQKGEYIQNSLISLSADDREFILSGISPNGWEYLEQDL